MLFKVCKVENELIISDVKTFGENYGSLPWKCPTQGKVESAENKQQKISTVMCEDKTIQK